MRFYNKRDLVVAGNFEFFHFFKRVSTGKEFLMK